MKSMNQTQETIVVVHVLGKAEELRNSLVTSQSTYWNILVDLKEVEKRKANEKHEPDTRNDCCGACTRQGRGIGKAKISQTDM